MTEEIQEEAPISISVDTVGTARVASLALPVDSVERLGRLWLEVGATCLKRLREPDASLPTRRLTRIRDPLQFLRLARRLPGALAVVALDASGRLLLREKPFESVADAAGWLRGRRGDWLIVRIETIEVMPPADTADPFARSLEEPGWIAATDRRVAGPFIDPGDFLVEWTFSWFPSGYYAVALMDHCERFDHRGLDAEAAPEAIAGPSIGKGAWHVFEKTPAGATRLIAASADRGEARRFVAAHRGLFLLAHCDEMLDMR